MPSYHRDMRWAAIIFLAAFIASAQSSAAQQVPPVDVLEVSGSIDDMARDFVVTEIEQAAERGSQLVVLQLDVPGVLTSEIDELLHLVDAPPLPVAVWVGPAPAVVHGAAAEMLRLAPIRSAAPGAVVGYRSPLVTGTDLSAPDGLANNDQVVIEAPVPGLVDVVEPALSNLLAALDGAEVTLRGETTRLETLGPATGSDGDPLLDAEGEPAETVVAEVRFHQPGPLQRVMRAALAPGVAFFLVAVGLAVAAFEFYAAGPGVAAAVAALCLLVGGYGMVMLPLRWWAVLLLMGGIWLLTAEFQVGRFGRWSLLGGVLLLVGGAFLADAEPHLSPSWWGVTIATLAVVLFYFAALPTVARARFSTQTVGRDHLIGRAGVATTGLGPDGEVEVDGARWSATSHRAAGITAGDRVTVTAVRGTVLEVEPGSGDGSIG